MGEISMFVGHCCGYKVFADHILSLSFADRFAINCYARDKKSGLLFYICNLLLSLPLEGMFFFEKIKNIIKTL